MNREKLQKYALNQLSEKSDIEKVIQWVEASPENRKEFNRLKNLWAYASFANFNELTKDNEEQTPKSKIVRFEILKYAAIFILAFIIGGLTIYFSGNEQKDNLAINEVIVPLGESAEVILPDQTHVWLNSGSHLKYPSHFENENRDVQLDGEAFFNVKHNPDKPFHVVTPSLTVKVLGTQFNVEAITENEEVNVTLIEGKVNLETNNGKFLTELKPNQNAVYSLNDNKLNIKPVNVEFYTSWTKGILLFKDEQLEGIAKKLERWYNVKIVFDDEAVKGIKFSGTILKNKPIDQILDILKFTSSIEYSITVKNEEPNIIHLKKEAYVTKKEIGKYWTYFPTPTI